MHSTVHDPELAPLADPEVFAAVQHLWREDLGEELTWRRARRYGPQIVAIVLATARYRRSRRRSFRTGNTSVA